MPITGASGKTISVQWHRWNPNNTTRLLVRVKASLVSMTDGKYETK